MYRGLWFNLSSPPSTNPNPISAKQNPCLVKHSLIPLDNFVLFKHYCCLMTFTMTAQSPNPIVALNSKIHSNVLEQAFLRLKSIIAEP